MSWNSKACRAALLTLAVCFLNLEGLSEQGPTGQFQITPTMQIALDSISATSLRGHLSFIASDLLAGRDSPSPGLDIAAEYIAAQFRRAGLEPLGDDGYFQTAQWLLSKPEMTGFSLTADIEGTSLKADAGEVSFRYNLGASLSTNEIVKIAYDKSSLTEAQSNNFRGKTVFTEIPDFRQQEEARWHELFKAQQAFVKQLRELGVALILSVDRVAAPGDGPGPASLIDPETRTQPPSKPAPFLRIQSPEWIKAYDSWAPGSRTGRVTLNLPAPSEYPARLRNVAGLLRGSDPVLRDGYVMVSAHYDHIGVKASGDGDRIYNGANDDGSGTAAVIELAAALSRMSIKPKRSLIFITFFGEEKGLMGSAFYGRHPLVPHAKTVADLNLEVVGRTDGSEGVEKDRASLTGFDYSTVAEVVQRAGTLVGVTVYKNEQASDAFFDRSDNLSLAKHGVPAHSLCTVFMYPDYHQVSDEWNKIDYQNLEHITRAVALGLIMIAEEPKAPLWNASNPKAEPYHKAWQSEHQSEGNHLDKSQSR